MARCHTWGKLSSFFFVGVVVFIHTKIKNRIKISDLVVFLPDFKFQV